MTTLGTRALHALRARRAGMLDDLRALACCESPSEDPTATRRCADLVAGLFHDRCGMTAETRAVDGRHHLLFRGGGPTRVLLVGHLDTVWPLGTLDRWPFAVDGDRATGPGVFDMKAGLVQLVHALGELETREGVTALVTNDEELGSPTSRELIEAEAADSRAALILEASADGALKTARKGVAIHRLTVTGQAAHAGLEPEKGVNATVEAAHQVLAIDRLGDPAAGTTVTPTVLRAGQVANAVAASAELTVDTRAASAAELRRVDAAVRGLGPVLPGARIRVDGGINRLPLERRASAHLFAVAAALADDLGLGPLGEAAVGGGSDGNLTAGVGTPTLDGLGAVGGHAHAEGEWVSVEALPERAALLAALVDALLTGS